MLFKTNTQTKVQGTLAESKCIILYINIQTNMQTLMTPISVNAFFSSVVPICNKNYTSMNIVNEILLHLKSLTVLKLMYEG